jgi:hypothetical protein
MNTSRASQAAGRPFVGYEPGRVLESAQQCGFEVIGDLRVWLRDPPS